MTESSLQRWYTLGTGTLPSWLSASRMRYSRSMAWAVFDTSGPGGRVRTTYFLPLLPVSRYVGLLRVVRERGKGARPRTRGEQRSRAGERGGEGAKGEEGRRVTHDWPNENWYTVGSILKPLTCASM